MVHHHPFSENSVSGKTVRQSVRDHDEDQTDDRFEQIDRSCKAELSAQQTFAIHKRIDDIRLLID
jgi:hypothetical protein